MSVNPNKDTQTRPATCQQLLSGRKTAGEIEDLLKDLRKAFIESALDGELTHLLGYEKHGASGRNSGNSRNGSFPKDESRASAGSSTSRSRATAGRVRAAADPQARDALRRLRRTILSLYSRGLTTREIRPTCGEIYGVEVSPDFVSTVSEAVSTRSGHGAPARSRPSSRSSTSMRLPVKVQRARAGHQTRPSIWRSASISKATRRPSGCGPRPGRRREILARHCHRVEAPRPAGHLHRLRRRAQRTCPKPSRASSRGPGPNLPGASWCDP